MFWGNERRQKPDISHLIWTWPNDLDLTKTIWTVQNHFRPKKGTRHQSALIYILDKFGCHNIYKSYFKLNFTIDIPIDIYCERSSNPDSSVWISPLRQVRFIRSAIWHSYWLHQINHTIQKSKKMVKQNTLLILLYKLIIW